MARFHRTSASREAFPVAAAGDAGCNLALLQPTRSTRATRPAVQFTPGRNVER